MYDHLHSGQIFHVSNMFLFIRIMREFILCFSANLEKCENKKGTKFEAKILKTMKKISLIKNIKYKLNHHQKQNRRN